MPRQRKKPVQNVNEPTGDSLKDDPIRFRSPPPRRGATDWYTRCRFLTHNKNRGRWALIRTMETPEQAYHAQSNLSRRFISIPFPEHDWGFAARGTEVYAVYRGPVRSQRRRRKELEAS